MHNFLEEVYKQLLEITDKVAEYPAFYEDLCLPQAVEVNESIDGIATSKPESIISTLSERLDDCLHTLVEERTNQENEFYKDHLSEVYNKLLEIKYHLSQSLKQ